MYSSVEQRFTSLEQMATIFRFCRNKLLIQWKFSIFTRVPWLIFSVRRSWFKVLTQKKIPLPNGWFSLQIHQPNNWPSRREYQLNLTLSTACISNRKKQANWASNEIFLAFPFVQKLKSVPYTGIRPLLEDANKCTLNYLFLHLYI